ncbi:MAG: NUDIX domain-containing protein [Candidatus Pacebacteria bacterium]|nr:NUDIX domain-containing protein [Candidatus Paceibacterota bacterium]
MDIHKEKLDVIDEQENILYQETRDNIHQKGLLHREIHVWLYTPSGNIIFQKRSPNKDTAPNLLDASVGGHVDMGEKPLESALKEIQEEAGILVDGDELIFMEKSRVDAIDSQTGKRNNVIRYIYALAYFGSLKELVPEEGAGEGFFSYSINELENLDNNQRQMFIGKMISTENILLYKKIIKN